MTIRYSVPRSRRAATRCRTAVAAKVLQPEEAAAFRRSPLAQRIHHQDKTGDPDAHNNAKQENQEEGGDGMELFIGKSSHRIGKECKDGRWNHHFRVKILWPISVSIAKHFWQTAVAALTLPPQDGARAALPALFWHTRIMERGQPCPPCFDTHVLQARKPARAPTHKSAGL